MVALATKVPTGAVGGGETVGVDLLTRSLLTSLLPVQAARGLVLHGLNAIGPLRRFAMRAGMAPPNALPSLMRPAASG